MAAAVSTTETFLSSVRPFRRERTEPEHSSWRLPPNHIADLSEVARGVEETDVGMCCKYLIDSMSGAGSDFREVVLEDVENFCEQNEIWEHTEVSAWRNRIKRCRRSLERLHNMGQHKTVSVLHIVYGHPDPSTREMPKKVFDNLGELASLARYTDAVEVRRQELARLEATAFSKRHVVYAPTKDIPAHWKALDDESIVEQTGDEASRLAIKQGMPSNYGPFLVDVMRHRELYESALRILTSGDALRSILAPVTEQDDNETEENFNERRVNMELKRDVLLVQVKVDASKMLEQASRLYHQSWLASAV